jgi:hypothetical protein
MFVNEYINFGEPLTEDDLHMLQNRWKLDAPLTPERAEGAGLSRLSSPEAAELLQIPDDDGFAGILVPAWSPIDNDGCHLKLNIVFDDEEAYSRVSEWRDALAHISSHIGDRYERLCDIGTAIEY